jgi:2',3'-cyclic-nucleotide 2'-phosphodiesterase (5'-nucleotidase family)
MKAKVLYVAVVLALLFGAVGTSAPVSWAAPTAPVAFTIVHTNDFHGQLEPSGSNPGMARVAAVVNGVRTAVGADNVLLVDAGDEMQGSLLSNLQKGEPTIAVFNAMGYNAATLGNHEFDWGQTVLIDRTTQATYPFVSANIVVNDTGDCATAGWTSPSFTTPYSVQTVGVAPNEITVGFIGVTTQETPYITIAEATEGLCFKDPAESIIHYYDELDALVDVIVVLSHLGFTDGGYGYGFPVYGDQTLAQRLITAGKPVPLIIGGHTHTDVPLPPPVVGGVTTVVQARYNGRQVGRADMTFDPATGAVTVNWSKTNVSTTGDMDPTIDALITAYASDPAYQALINQPIGYSAVDLPRLGGTGDNMMGTFVDDAIYNALNNDGEPANDVDLFFNNAGGIRTDWCWDGTDWINTGCVAGTHAPGLLTYGDMFTILPFGNATVVGDMTGAQILMVLNQAPLVSNGVIQPAGLKYKYYRYADMLPPATTTTPYPWAWGAFDYCVVNRATQVCEPLDMNKTYRVGTNEFLAPAGGDGYGGFKYMTNISYWGDMLNAVNAWVTANYTLAEPYTGPNGDGTLDGRIIRDGTDAGGSIVPVTILHHNDPHGNLLKSGNYPGLTQLATLVNQERAHNPTRTLLLNAGDTIQGDAMMYYFKTAALGYSADGTSLPPELRIQPMIAAMNAMNYAAMTLGNHEFNFGNRIFTSVLGMANFPILGANVSDDGSYGLAQVPVLPEVKVVLPGPAGVIDVAILGITNHRVPNYELPSNIPGLTFPNPINVAKARVPDLASSNDVVIALTHIGFTTNPSSVEVDNNVDTYLAAQVRDIDAIIGGHSHTDPSQQTIYSGDYKFLPTIIGAPDDDPVLVTQAYRYNNYLGEVVLGLRPADIQGVVDYEVVARAGRYIKVDAANTPEDPTVKAIIQPYADLLAAYNNTVLGQTTVPIDALTAFTQETNAANLQADASVWELAQHDIDVDFHLSGAMTNRKIADSATPATPYTLKVSDMFTLMPYENSLLALRMNGPQLKMVLERAYRNYYYYKYVPGYGGYSYYTTCMLDTNAGNQIVYRDLYPAPPNGDNVAALMVNGHPVDFADASTYYTVSTVNYLAAGSCNFNDDGVTLWPLDQIVNDTQYYVRDAVINYVQDQGTVSPGIEGRVVFQIPHYYFYYLPIILKNH